MHTAGRWKARNQRVEGPCGILIGFCGENGIVGEIDSYHIDYEEALANARLIAAAPDMLDLINQADVEHLMHLEYGKRFCDEDCPGCEWEKQRDSLLAQLED